MTGPDDCKALLAKLGKHTTGKGCLYIKKLADCGPTGVEGDGRQVRGRHANAVI